MKWDTWLLKLLGLGSFVRLPYETSQEDNFEAANLDINHLLSDIYRKVCVLNT